MQMFKKNKNQANLIISSLLFLVIFFVFNSCNIFEETQTDETQALTTDQEIVSGQQNKQDEMQIIEIEIWDRLNPKEQIELMNSMQIFNENNNNLKIITRHLRSEEELIDQFKAASLAGAGPDIIIANLASTTELAKARVIKKIPEDLKHFDIFEGLKEISEFEREDYAIAFRAFNFLILYYNKDFLEKAPKDFTELITYCKNVNNPNDNTWGFLFNLNEPDWIIPFVGGYQNWVYDYITGSVSLNSEAMANSLSFLLNIYNEEKIIPTRLSYEDINDAFKIGKAHMIINGDWAKNEYENEGINFGIAKIPVVLDGLKNPTPMVDGIGFMINVNTYGKKLEVSKKLIDFLMSEEIQISWTLRTDTYTVLKSLKDLPEIKNNNVFYGISEQLAICRGKIPDDSLRVIRDAIRMNIENVMNGSISPQDAVIKMQEDAINLKTKKTETLQDFKPKDEDQSSQ
mgnify:CR=1 FL=1